jgi:hypothetical protein
MGRVFLFVLVELCGLALIAAWVIDPEANYAQPCLGGGIGLAAIGAIGIFMGILRNIQRSMRLRSGRCPNCALELSGMSDHCQFCNELIAA